MQDTVAVAPPPDRLEQAGLFALFGVAGAVEFSIAAAQILLALALLAWLAMLCLLAGCVERRFIITPEPFGAIVYDEKGLPTGASPADRQFTYYGKYRFTLVRDAVVTGDLLIPHRR